MHVNMHASTHALASSNLITIRDRQGNYWWRGTAIRQTLFHMPGLVMLI